MDENIQIDKVQDKPEENKTVDLKIYVETPSTIVVRKKSDKGNDTKNGTKNVNNLHSSLINPFSKENIDEIELRDIAIIFNSADMLSDVMKYYVYDLESCNVNFYKENENDKTIKVLLPGREIVDILHSKFLYMVNVNFIELCLKLLHRFHDVLTVEQLYSAMKVLNEYEDNLSQTTYLKKKHKKFSIWK
jgi:hypothetical protein